MIMRTERAKKLLEDFNEIDIDNVFSANRIYGQAMVYYQIGEITLHELEHFRDLRNDVNIKFIERGF